MSETTEKGTTYLGPCNRTACQNPGADHWNYSTRAWYCAECAQAINAHAFRDCSFNICWHVNEARDKWSMIAARARYGDSFPYTQVAPLPATPRPAVDLPRNLPWRFVSSTLSPDRGHVFDAKGCTVSLVSREDGEAIVAAVNGVVAAADALAEITRLGDLLGDAQSECDRLSSLARANQKDLADALAKLAVAEGERWIPVAKRLPGLRELVLAHQAFPEGETDICLYMREHPFSKKESDREWRCPDSGRQCFGVTHWQPLPAAPADATPNTPKGS